MNNIVFVFGCFLLGPSFSSLLLPAVVVGKTIPVSSENSLRGGQQHVVVRELNSIHCGCAGCDTSAFNAMAGDHSCGSRIDWVQNTRTMSEREACMVVAGQDYPNECGSCNPETCDDTSSISVVETVTVVTATTNMACGCSTCTETVFDNDAGEYKCGDRIEYLRNHRGYSEQDACTDVAEEFQDACGECNPDLCLNNVTPDYNNSNNNNNPSPPRTEESVPVTVTTNMSACGCSTCTETVFDTFAGENKCGDRIVYLQNSQGYNERDACSFVAKEYQAECGGCDPDRCHDDVTPVSNSSNNNNNDNNNALKVINNTPTIKHGATIFDKNDQASISVFGESCLDVGCLVEGGETLNVGNIAGTQDRTNYLLGIQWNVARVAPDHGLCDNPCRQMRVDLNACTFLSYETSGTCYTNAGGIENYAPRWYPEVSMAFEHDATGTTCTLTVTTASAMETIDGTEPDACGCQWGNYPCTCGPHQDADCVGQCPGDDDTASQCNPYGSKPDECCFCEDSTNTCHD